MRQREHLHPWHGLDARKHLLQGADNVLVNTAAVKRPELISEIAQVMGCQSVMIYVEAKRRDGWWECLTDNARECSGRNVVEWVKQAVFLGAGEVLLASVDRDGTRQGYDLELIHAVSQGLAVPLIASGGCGKPEDAVEAVRAGADAVAVSSLLHYGAIDRINSPGSHHEGNLEYLRGRRGPALPGASIGAIKAALQQAGYSVRGPESPRFVPTSPRVG